MEIVRLEHGPCVHFTSPHHDFHSVAPDADLVDGAALPFRRAGGKRDGGEGEEGGSTGPTVQRPFVTSSAATKRQRRCFAETS